jgi:hypothetical protein
MKEVIGIRHGGGGGPTYAARGGILGGNPDRSLKSFPPCYSQTPLLSNCTPHLLFFGLEISASNSWEGGVGFWVYKYMDQ